MEDFLDTEEFYNLMQAYRLAPVGNQHQVIRAFENVRAYIRAHALIGLVPEGYTGSEFSPPSLEVEPMLRIIVREVDIGAAANIGGHPVDIAFRTFDVELPELESYLCQQLSSATREVIGVEVKPGPHGQ